MTHSPVEYAMSYASRGWPVFPCHTVEAGVCTCSRAEGCQHPGKHPRTEHGFKEATLDITIIRRWWDRWPHANIGIATGGTAGLAVLDVDPRHGGDESYELLAAALGAIETLVSETPSGGRHFYTNVGTVSLASRVGIEPGIDLRAAGGYVIAPPSVGMSGTYSWDTLSGDPDDRVTDLPSTWRERLVPASRSAPAPAVDGEIPEGSRNSTLTSLAGSMRHRGMVELEIRTAIAGVNANRCKPPLDDDEVATIAHSVAQYPGELPRRGIATGGEGAEDAEDAPLSHSDADSNDDTLATKLVAIARGSGAELFHDADQEPYVQVPRETVRETLRLKDKAFSRWLSGLAYREMGRALSSATLSDAVRTLEAIACYEGEERPVYLRLAPIDAGIVLDLGSSEWNAVMIGPTGWRLTAQPPVVFRRSAGLLKLPEPVRGGSISELRCFVNCAEEDWPMLLSWVVAALRPRGPYPVLALLGEQGSAKSTTAKVLRALVDPNKAPLRNPSRTDRDMMVTATHSWVLGYDNVSQIPVWLSDAFCCVSTGSGYGGRALYTDDSESILTANRPIILTGIEDYVTRADLLDRSMLCTAPRIIDAARKDEETFWAAFELARPRILGALLDAVVHGLARLPKLHLANLPRMADFARWSVACEPALGLADGAILSALSRNRHEAMQVSLEANPIATAVRALLDEQALVEMTATDLLELLTSQRGSGTLPKSWPKNGQALSGLLRRLAGDLRSVGIEFERDKTERNAHRLIRLRKVGGDIVHTVHPVHTEGPSPIPVQASLPAARTINGSVRADDGCECGTSTSLVSTARGSLWVTVDDVDEEDDLGPATGEGGAS